MVQPNQHCSSRDPTIRRQHRRKHQQHCGRGGICRSLLHLPLLFVVTTISIWGGGALYILQNESASSSLSRKQQQQTAILRPSEVLLREQQQNNILLKKKTTSRVVAQAVDGPPQPPPAAAARKKYENNNSPWFGWQPDPYPDSAPDACTTVRKCLEGTGKFQDHGCPNCRDNPTDLAADIPKDPGPDWIPDATMLHRMYLVGVDAKGKPWPPPLPAEYCEEMGGQGGRNDGNKKLLDLVPIRGMTEEDPTTTKLKGGRLPKLFCGVYTMESNHASNIRAMRETWAPQCDGFVAFSTATDPRLPAIAIEHEGPEEYANMWQKVRSIWRFIGRHYLSDFDYFILGGEDLLLFPTNLRHYLAGLQDRSSPEDDLFAGRRFKGYGKDNYFNSGGAGYVLSRGTLRKFYETGLDHPACSQHRHTSMEDVMVAQCLRKAFGIGLTDTRDEQGRERFHPFSPAGHLNWKPPKPGADAPGWYFNYNKEWGIKLGVECCAPDSVSFHYIKKPAMVRHLFALMYQCHK